MKPTAGLAHDQMCSVKQRWVIMTQVSRLQCRRHLAVEMFPGNGTQRKVTEEWWISVSSSRLVWAMTRASINLSHLSRARFRVRKEEVLVLSLQRVTGPPLTWWAKEPDVRRLELLPSQAWSLGLWYMLFAIHHLFGCYFLLFFSNKCKDNDASHFFFLSEMTTSLPA